MTGLGSGFFRGGGVKPKTAASWGFSHPVSHRWGQQRQSLLTVTRTSSHQDPFMTPDQAFSWCSAHPITGGGMGCMPSSTCWGPPSDGTPHSGSGSGPTVGWLAFGASMIHVLVSFFYKSPFSSRPSKGPNHSADVWQSRPLKDPFLSYGSHASLHHKTTWRDRRNLNPTPPRIHDSEVPSPLAPPWGGLAPHGPRPDILLAGPSCTSSGLSGAPACRSCTRWLPRGAVTRPLACGRSSGRPSCWRSTTSRTRRQV